METILVLLIVGVDPVGDGDRRPSSSARRGRVRSDAAGRGYTTRMAAKADILRVQVWMGHADKRRPAATCTSRRATTTPSSSTLHAVGDVVWHQDRRLTEIVERRADHAAGGAPPGAPPAGQPRTARRQALHRQGQKDARVGSASSNRRDQPVSAA